MRWLDGITTFMDTSLRVRDGQGSLTCCSPWGHKESDTAEQLKRTELKLKLRCSSHMMRRTDSLEKTLMMGKTEGRRRG